MSLPQNVQIGDENFFNLENYASDPDLLYFQALKESLGMCERSIQHEVKDLNLSTPLEQFGQTVDFAENVQEKLRDQGMKQTEEQVHQFANSLKCQISEYHLRNSIFINIALKNKQRNEFTMAEDFNTTISKIKECALDQWSSTKLKGNNPAKWPIGLADFIKDIQKQPLLSQFNEPEYVFKEFSDKVKSLIESKKNEINNSTLSENERQQRIDLMAESFCALFLVSFSRGSLISLMKQLDFMEEFSTSFNDKEVDFLISKIQEITTPCFQALKKQMNEYTQLHCMKNICDQGGFCISTLHQYSKQNFSTSSITTDGTYLYIYISSVEGGMFKIGTGKNNTVAGKVYEKAPIQKIEEVAWTYLKGKLYLRAASKEIQGLLEVYSSKNFEYIETIQLKNEDMFETHSQLNKGYPLLSDGKFLYLIGKKITSQPIKEVKKSSQPQKPEESKPQKAKEDENAPAEEASIKAAVNGRKVAKIKPSKALANPSPEEIASSNVVFREIEFILYKYDLETLYVEKQKEEKVMESEFIQIEEAQLLGVTSPELLATLSQQHQQEVNNLKSLEQSEKEKIIEEEKEANKNEENQQKLEQKPQDQTQEDKQLVDIKEKQLSEIPEEANKKESIDADKKILPEIPKEIDKKAEIADKEIIKPLAEGQLPHNEEQVPVQQVHKQEGAEVIAGEDKKEQESIPAPEVNIQKDVQENSEAAEQNKVLEKDQCPEKEAHQIPQEYLEQESESKVLPKESQNLSKEKIYPEELVDKILSKDTSIKVEMKKDASHVSQKTNSISDLKKETSSIEQQSQSQSSQVINNNIKKDSKKSVKFAILSRTLLAQSEIIPELTKQIKNVSEVAVKEYSIISPLNISQSLWTMNEDQITLYSDQTIKVFSKHSKDEHLIDPSTYFKSQKGPQSNKSSNEREERDLDTEIVLQTQEEDDFDLLEQEKINILSKFNKSIKFPKDKSNTSILQQMNEDLEQKIAFLQQPLFCVEGKKLSLKKEGSSSNPQKKEQPEKEKEVKLVEKEKRLMKTTLIAKIELKKKLFPLNPNFQACYDSQNGGFYVFAWAQSCFGNIFPSIITKVYDQNQYSKHSIFSFLESDLFKQDQLNDELEKSKIDTPSKLKQYLVNELLTLQKYRFQLPWKLNRWDYIYGYALVDLLNKQLNQQFKTEGNGEQEQKKAISRGKAKVISRLNKQLESQKAEYKIEKEMIQNQERVFRELQKDYAFCIEGNSEMIYYLGDKIIRESREQEIKQLLEAIAYWFQHSQELSVRESKVNLMMKNICLKIIEWVSNKEFENSTKQAATYIFLRSWKYIARSNADQIEWISKFKQLNKISSISWVESILLSFPTQDGGNVQESFPLKESVIEGISDGQVIELIDTTTNITQVFRSNQIGISSNAFNEPLARLLFDDNSFIDILQSASNQFDEFYKSGYIREEAEKKQFQEWSNTFWQEIEFEILESISHQNSTQAVSTWKLIRQLIQDANFILLRIADKEVEISQRLSIYKKFIELLEKSLDGLLQIEIPQQQDAPNAFISKQLEEINSIISLFLQFNFSASITSKPPGIIAIKQLIKLFTKMKAFLKVGDACLAEQLFSSHAEGLDQTIEKVFETNHPYERGKVIQFEQNMFPGAFAVAINFDKRCQSDASNDFLKIAGWYDIHSKGAQSTGYSISSREGLGKVFKLSGKAVPKRQLIILGDTIQVEFHSSAHAKDEKSLSRWGYKLSARPIYGMSKKMWTDTDSHSPQLVKVAQLFGNDNLLAEWLNTMKLCILSITQSAKNLCTEDQLQEKNTSFLELAILRNGFSSSKSIEKYLIKESQQLWDLKQNDSLVLPQKNSVTFSDNSHSQLRQVLQNKIYRGQFIQDFETKLTINKNDKPLNQSQPTLSVNWHLQSSDENQILSKCVQQIKEKQGEFFIYSREVASKLRDPMQYIHEKVRPTFKQEYKELWQQCEALILLSCLHHSGLLQTGLSHCKEYILENLQGLQETRSGIILKMLSLVQQEKEFHHTIESLIEAKVEYDQIKAEAALLAQKQKLEQEEKEKEKLKIQQQNAQNAKAANPPLLQFIKQGKKLKVVKAVVPSKSNSKVSSTSTSNTKSKATAVVEEKVPEKKDKQEEDKLAKQWKEGSESDEEFKEEYESDEEISIVQKKILKRSASKKTLLNKNNKSEQQITPELSSFLWDKFQKRFGGGNNDALKQLCESRAVVYQEDNLLACTKHIFQICKNSLISYSTGKSHDNNSPYEIIGVRIAQKCLLLLSLSDRNSLQLEAQDDLPDLVSKGMVRGDSTCSDIDIKPVGVNRSISQPINEKLVDKERLKSFRSWVNSYQKWKQCRQASELSETTNEEKSELYSIQNYDALKSITFFLCSHVTSEEIIATLERHDIICAQRISCLSLLNYVYPIVANTCFERYLAGSVNELLGCHIQQEVTCASKPLKDLQQQELLNLLSKSIDLVNRKVERISKIQLQDLVGQVQRVKNENKMSIGLNGLLQEYLKLVNLALADILSLVSNDLLQKLYNVQNEQHQQELKTFLASLINLGLVSVTFSLMSSRFEDIVLLVGYSQHLVDAILTKIILNTPDPFTHILLKIIYDIFSKELGFQPSESSSTNSSTQKQEDISKSPEVNARIFLRIFDPIGQLRISFLLSHLEVLLSKRISKPESKTTGVLPLLQSLSEILLYLAYHSETPIQVRLILKCLKPLSDFLRDEVESSNPSLFESKFFYYEIEGLQEIISQCSKDHNMSNSLSLISNPTLKKKYLDFSQPQSTIFPLKGVRLLFEKIGNYILNEQQIFVSLTSSIQQQQLSQEQSPALRQSLTTLLNKSQFQSQHKNRNSSLYMSFNSDSGKKKEKSLSSSNNNQGNTFIVLGQLSEEEDLTFLLKVLYYWEELYPTSTSLSQPKTLEDYLELKKQQQLKKEADLKKEALARSQAAQQNSEKHEDPSSENSSRLHKLIERIFIALPEINGVSLKEEDLPIGWQFNYIGLYNDLNVFLFDTKRGKIKKKVKQVWQNANLTALIKKMEQADKDIKEFEEADTLENKMEVIKARNFISRIQQHLKDIQTIASLLNIFGYGPMFDFLSQDKAEELASLVNYSIRNQLKPIPIDNIKESYRKLLDPNEVAAAKIDKKSVVQKDSEYDKHSKMVVQVCNSSLFPLYEIGIDLVTSLSSKESFFSDANASSILQTHCKGGQSSNNIISEVVEFFRHICNDQKLVDIQKDSLQLSLNTLISKNWESELKPVDRSYIAGVLNVIGGWPQSVRQTAKGILNNVDYEQGMECILSGGIGSGQDKCNIISTTSSSIAVQTVQIKTLTPMFTKQWIIGGFNFYEELFKAIVKCAELMSAARHNQQDSVEKKVVNKQQVEKQDTQKEEIPEKLNSDTKEAEKPVPEVQQVQAQEENKNKEKQEIKEKIEESNKEDKPIEQQIPSDQQEQNNHKAEEVPILAELKEELKVELKEEEIPVLKEKKEESNIKDQEIKKIQKEESKSEIQNQTQQEILEEKKEEDYSWEIRSGMLMRFLLQIATTVEWNTAVESGSISKADGLRLLEIIRSMCGESQQEKLSWRASEEEFISAWEDYVDKSEGILEQMRFPQQFNQKKSHSKFIKEDTLSFPSLKKLTSSQAATISGEIGELVPSPSAYAASLPQEQPEVAENKLLKYWEKFVIPKIYDFVKSTLKPYELEDFFEQIRSPLRKGDQPSAMKVAYIICEKNLPAGVVLPDANHDWNTIAVEDVRVGQWLIASICSNKGSQLLSPFFSKEKLLQGTHVPVLAIGIDARNAAVLCLYRDHDKAHVISLWIPVTSLKQPEQPIRPPTSCYSRNFIQQVFLQSMARNITVLSRQVLLQFFSLESSRSIHSQTLETSLTKQSDLLLDLKLSFLDILRSSVVEEVIDDPIFGWINTNGSSLFLTDEISKIFAQFNSHSSFIPKPEEEQFAVLRNNIKHDASSLSSQQTQLVPFKRLRQIQQYLDWSALRKKPVISELFEHISNHFKNLVLLINKYVTEINIIQQAQINSPDGQVQNSNCSKPFKLFQFEGSDAETIGSVVLTFSKDAILGVYSGLKFFQDGLGINKISQLNAGKQSKKQIEPMMFRGKDVYCSYYFNKHQLSPFEADTNQSQLPCIIYGIPKDWNMICWLIDTMASSLMKTKDDKQSLERFGKMMGILTESFQSLRGPSIIKQLLAKLITRTARKLRFLVRSQIYSGALKVNAGEEVSMHWKILGVKSDFLKQQVTKIKEIRSFFKQDQSLHSSFIQDYMEMVCTLLVPLTFSIKDRVTFNPRDLVKGQNFPRWLEYGVNIQLLMNFFENDGLLPKEILERLVQSQLQFEDNQNKNLVLLTNLPTEWSDEYLRKNVLSVIQKSKLRILTPSIDIQIIKQEESLNNIAENKGNLAENKSLVKACLILLDGSSALDLEEVAQEKKKEEAEKAKAEAILQSESGVVKPPVVAAHPELWTCEACTLQNPWESLICDVCETAKPLNAGMQEEQEEEEGGDQDLTNLAEDDSPSLEEQLIGEQEEQTGRVEKFREYMKQLVIDYYANKKIEKEKEIVSLLAIKVIAEQKFNEEKIKLEAEIEKKEAKEKKNQEKLKIEEAKKKKKSQNKKGNKESKQSTENDSQTKVATVIDPALESLQIELREKRSQFEEQIKSFEVQQIDKKKLIAEYDSLKDISCKSVQGREEISKEQFFAEFFDNFIRNRYLQKDSSKLKVGLQKKLEKRIQTLPSSVLQGILSKLKLDKSQDVKTNDSILNKIQELIVTQGQAHQVILILSELGMDLHFDVVKHISGEKVQVLPISQISQLLKYIEGEICKETKMVLKYNATSIRFNKSSYAFSTDDTSLGYSSDSATLPYTRLTEYPLSEIRLSWALVKLMNKILESIVQLINMSSKQEVLDYHIQAQQNKNGIVLPLSLSDQLSSYRSFWMSPIKIELSQRVFKMTAIKRDSVPKVQVERLKLQRESDATAINQFESEIPTIIPTKNLKNVVTINFKDNFLFTKAYDQIKDLPVTLLRPIKPTGTDPFIAFETIFKGELVMGEAGPYRQFFADISSELQTNILSSYSENRQLNLMLPSTNNLSKSGDARDKYVINPSAKSSYQLQLFEFLGVLMGTCVRTGTHLTLDLPKILWKQLVGEQISLDDLEEIDRPVVDMIKFIDSCDKLVFQESFFETYTTTLSDFSTVELKKHGSKINVTYEDRLDYIARAVEAKVRESSLQIQAIKSGLNKIIPAALLSTVLASDLEMWVCGRKRVDFDLLKRHTIYSVGLSEETPHIKFLWEVLHELEHKESLRFVKFCWGQERLPANDEEFERNQIRFMIKPTSYALSNPDLGLPKADTCFFNLELPAYTTKAALKGKLLLAINTDCDSMNAENPIALDPDQGYTGDNGNYSSEEDEEDHNPDGDQYHQNQRQNFE